VTTFYLVRHGQTEWNALGRIQGRSDIPLNEVGRAQAQEAAEALEMSGLQAIYSSPLSRALDTASIMAAHLGLPDPVLLDGVIERDYGIAEGLDHAGIQATFPDGKLRGRENRREVADRAIEALRSIDGDFDDVAVVCHGGVIGSLVRVATDYALPLPGDVIANGSFHVFDFARDRLRLIEFNGRPVLESQRP